LPDRRSLVVVFLAAFVCRAALWAAALPDPSRLLSPPDSDEYLTIAQNVAAGHGFSADSSPPYRPDIRRTPVYTTLLSSVFLVPSGDARLASLAGALISASTVAATYWIAWRLFGPIAALIGAVLLTLDLTSASYSVLILTEAVFTALVAAGVLVLLRRPLGRPIDMQSGALLGCATLCRPAGVLLGLVSLPVCAWRQSRWSAVARHYLWVNATFFLVALVWVARNFIVADTLTLSSIASVNLYFHRAAAVEARLQGKNAGEIRAAWERQFESLSAQWSDAEKLEWMTAHAREVILSHPITYLQITVDGFVYMMQSDPFELRRLLGLREGSSAYDAAGVAASVQLWLVYPAAVLGVLASVRNVERRRAALVPLAFIAYFVLVSGPEAYPRFRVPIMPFMAMLSGVGIERLMTSIRSRGVP
jgi:4-amino-4-deoxy-L-arabinose transferase-like glycosyltransferase